MLAAQVLEGALHALAATLLGLLALIFDERAGYVIAALCLSLFDDAARQIKLSSQIPFPSLHQIYSHYRTDKLICADLSS